MTYATQPRIYPESRFAPARVRLSNAISRAQTAGDHSQSMRICLFGDSTYTSPGGFGVSLHHTLTGRLAQFFGGNVPGTMSRTPHVSTNGCPFLGMTNNNRKTVSADWYSTAHDAVGESNVALPFSSGEGSYQPAAIFDPACGFSLPLLKKYTAHTMPNANLKLELKFFKQENSAEDIRVRWAPTTAASANLFASVVADEDFTIALNENVSQVELVTYTTTPRTPTEGAPFAQWFFQSGEATTAGAGSVAPPVLCGVRVLQENPVGCMVDLRGISGGNSKSLLGDTLTGASGNYANSMPWLSQLGYDVVVLGLGTNDIFGAGFEPEDIRRQYYDADGTDNLGFVGEWVAECNRRGLTPPLFVFSVPPHRGADSTGYTELKDSKYKTIADEMVALVDELTSAGIDSVMLNTYLIAEQLGMTAEYNDTTGLTDRGTYDTGSVSYTVGDFYKSGVDNQSYRCVRDHTSSAAFAPTDSSASAATAHLPLKVHLSDGLHRTVEGALLEAEAFGYLFQQNLPDKQIPGGIQSLDIQGRRVGQ